MEKERPLVFKKSEYRIIFLSALVLRPVQDKGFSYIQGMSVVLWVEVPSMRQFWELLVMRYYLLNYVYKFDILSFICVLCFYADKNLRTQKSGFERPHNYAKGLNRSKTRCQRTHFI